MTATVLEKATEQVTDTAHKISDAMKDRFNSARRFVKESEELADELYDTSTRQIRRHPAESVVLTFAAGFAAGILMGWMIGKK